MSLKKKSEADLLFQMGKLYFERCDFKLANEIFEQLRTDALTENDGERYSEVASIQLRIAAELEDQKRIEELKHEISTQLKKGNIEPTPRVYYSLGLCASYQSDNALALEYLERSLALGLSKNDKVGICYAITGLVMVYTSMNKLEEALKEIYNLNVFFQVLDLPDLKLSTKIMNGHILKFMGKNEEALQIFFDCFENLKTNSNFYMHVHVLYALGITNLALGRKEQAATYLALTQRSIGPDSLRRTLRLATEKLAELGESSLTNYDLVFNSDSNRLTERKRGDVDFGNQFIMVDMLKLFLKKPGEIFSKEAIVKKVWRQEYDPRMHDNKLYVTIKRLRELIEPEIDKPRYIFRAKNGYYLNKNARVLFNESTDNQ